MLKENLLLLRNIHGYSQETIAGKIGVSRQAYAKWEAGATLPDIEKCCRLAREYGITLDSLMKTETAPGIGMIPPAPKGKNIWGSLTVGDRGQIVLPKAVRDSFGIGSGQRLVLLSDEEGIVLLPAETFEAKMHAILETASQDKTETE